MKYATIFSTMTALVAARSNIQQGGNEMSSGGPGNAAVANNPPAAGQQLTGMPTTLTASQKAQLQAASIQWSKDTSTVSCALNMGLKAVQQPGSVSNQDFIDIMDAGYDAEVDETINKATIDALLGDMPILQSASANLTNGTFISVVDGLREMAIRGLSNMTVVKQTVDLMNTNRCRPIMQAIDAYVQTAAAAVGNTTFVSAVRPMTCLNVTAQTGQPITQQVVNNCTVAPRANELSRDYGQSPTFQLSRVVATGNNPGTDTTGQLGDTFPNAANMSSSQGQQPGLFQNAQFPINGNPQNTIANPVNADFGVAATQANTNGTSAPPPANGPSGTGNPLNAPNNPGASAQAPSTGTTGSSNSTASTGSTGSSGSTGTGATGSSGQTGTGATGSSGATGSTGASGKGGATGATGAQPAAGKGGASGVTGATGASGARPAAGQGQAGVGRGNRMFRA